MEGHRLRDEQRAVALPEIGALVKGFLDRDLVIAEFRETFDRKTRNEWDLFGLKGLSGAMFLNKLVKHLSDQDELRASCRLRSRFLSTMTRRANRSMNSQRI